MSSSGYGYYYPQNSQNYPSDPNQSWSSWSLEQQQYDNSYNRNNPQYSSSAANHATHHQTAGSRSQHFYNGNNRQFQRRSAPSYPQYPQQNWAPRNPYKRPRLQDMLSENGESRNKGTKKRKKPLSQNVPSKKEWTLSEATTALNVEKEYNKRFKNHSLIIKFPDLELNRDIVAKFDSAIENVHFQQPSTPRFCFVTLQESADADKVIENLNKIPFGSGLLTAEYKKDREEDQNIGPEDIDPTTLYVGNLAQEITKDEMVQMYPAQKRIDIGYAKKMKYTRYAFVSFKTVSDSIEAFKKTHSTQKYSKSLIVRFRRLHGTVGMPGESKPQSPVKSKLDNVASSEEARVNALPDVAKEPGPAELDMSVVKQELNSSDYEDDGEYTSPFMAGSIDVAMGNHRPMIKKEIKRETDGVDDYAESPASRQSGQDIGGLDENLTNNYLGEVRNNSSLRHTANEFLESVKREPHIKNENTDYGGAEEEEDSEEESLNFGTLLQEVEDRSLQIDSVKRMV